MKTDTTNNSKRKHISARARLIPAVAMLTTSAIMLSTSTYAWFTMNKEVEVTGLQMTAVAAEGIEISLGAINVATPNTIKQPKDTDLVWSNSFAVGDCYDTLGKLRPASSVDGVNLFYATDASNQGKTAEKFSAVTVTDAATTNVRSAYTTGNAVSASVKDDDIGYYVDIPFYIRTQETAPAGSTEEIYATVTITDDGDKNTTDELYKAARFVILDTNGANVSGIFGADNAYYETANSKAQAIKGATSGEKSRNDVLGDVTVTGSTETLTSLTFSGPATGSTFRTGSYVMRVWLEGESTSCWNPNAQQSWGISMKLERKVTTP